MYWQKHRRDIFIIIRDNITLLDEYGVENAHSILRADTRAHYTVEQLVHKAKTIFASRSGQKNFRSSHSPPKYYSFATKQLNTLEIKAATILKNLFVEKTGKLINGDSSVNQKIWGSDSINIY